MPLTQSAIRQSRRSEVRRAMLRPVKTKMKTALRALGDLIKEGKKAEAGKLLPTVYKVVDMAAKKRIIHWKNAANKKSHAASLVAALGGKN